MAPGWLLVRGAPRLLLPPVAATVSARGIVSRALRQKEVLPEGHPATIRPWPYKERGYNLWHALIFDRKTSKRFHENTRVVVVDGPLAAGKTALAKALATELDMVYFPEANMDQTYITPQGYDMRQLNSQLPESCKTYDASDFHREPKHLNTGAFQLNMYRLRYFQYVDALAHLLNTGQGVVMDRSVYSDTVFLESMAAEGFISPGARSVYHEVRANTISELLRPHLVVYLDVPVSEVKNRLQKRPVEAKSKVLQTNFLERMDEEYKKRFLPEIEKHAQVLVYDWAWSSSDLTPDVVETVVEDVERVKLEGFEKHDAKLGDWRKGDEDDWNGFRKLFTNHQDILQCYFNVPRNDVPEMLVSGEDALQYRKVWWNAPGMKYTQGFNEEVGDKNLLFKMK